ncbi:MAG: hypothetical protein DWQ36_06515 [Acidobacteria bacterium]|nr:MAG: hypothetical protein DWQ30_08425 [Acidobacteriota bacterium]REK09509.1 MAG: hypothetical protein DWQ36_06515 [Acidobacteriota bacterium]
MRRRTWGRAIAATVVALSLAAGAHPASGQEQQQEQEAQQQPLSTREGRVGAPQADPLALARARLAAADAAGALETLASAPPEVRSSAEWGHLRVHGLIDSGRLDEALSAARAAIESDAGSSLRHVTLADAALALGDFNLAGQSYYQGATLPPVDGRANLGLARLFQAERRLQSAQRELRAALERRATDSRAGDLALALLPADEIGRWYDLEASPSELLGSGVATESLAELLEQRGDCSLTSPRRSYEIPLRQLRPRPGWDDRIGIEMRFGGAVEERVLLDTGASGLLISRSLAEAAGAERLRDTVVRGIGDEGARQAFVARVDRISAGDVVYENCLVRVVDDEVMTGSHGGAILGIDGLWDDFLITLDIPRLRMVLEPHPPFPALPGGEPDRWRYERDLRSLEPGWAPVRLFGHYVILPALLDEKVETYFLLDTGAWATILSQRVADQLGVDQRESSIQIQGLSGTVEVVPEVHGDVTLMFPGVQQEHRNLKILDLDRHARGGGVGFGGIIGYSLLRFTELTIDGRRALVRIVPGEVRRRPTRIR